MTPLGRYLASLAPLVLRLHREGKTERQIMAVSLLSLRRVRRILRSHSKESGE